MSAVMQMPIKQVSEILDYDFIMAQLLGAGEHCTALTVTLTGPDSSMVLENTEPDLVNAVLKCWVSGGTDWKTYTLRCLMVTDRSVGNGKFRTEEAVMAIPVREYPKS